MKLWDRLANLIITVPPAEVGVVEGEVIGEEISVGDDDVNDSDQALGILDDPPPLPTTITAEIRASMAMEQISLAVTRLSQEIFTNDRGTMEYDGISETFICHLTPNELDRVAVGPLFAQALEIWMVIDAHTEDKGPNQEGWGL